MIYPPRKSLLYGLLAVSAFSAPTAQAVTVTTIGSFNDPTSTGYLFDIDINQDDASTGLSPMPANVSKYSTTNSLAYYGWGIDVGQSLSTHTIIQSHFWFNGAGSVGGDPAAEVPLGTAFSMGLFTYTNEETILSGGIVNIDFQMAINVDGLSLAPAEYRIRINNTLNGPSNPFDTAEIISTPASISFLLDGSPYLLTFNGFSRDGGENFETVAELGEGMRTTAEIYATITAVPAPAAIWLMGTGLLALAGFARTKK
ncbi:MAG: hypothetical protein QG652_380 [Pseudomonadota bacterium]|nr:hypothetical protein [Pseudomonadota bacterium]